MALLLPRLRKLPETSRHTLRFGSLGGSPPGFGCVCVEGKNVDKILGFRPFRAAPDGPRHMVFIDARAFGKPICCRLFSQTVFRAEDFLYALDIELSARFTVRFTGSDAAPVADDPFVWLVKHCSSVTLQVAHVAPASSPSTDGMESEASDADDADD